MQLLFGPAYWVASFLAFFAVWTGIEVWLGINAFFAFFLTLFVVGIPFVGMLMSPFVAMDIWNWSAFAAWGLFIGVPGAILLYSFIVVMVEERR